MIYKKNVEPTGTIVFSAIDPDYEHELQVVQTSKGLPYQIGFWPKPTPDSRQEIDIKEFATAYNNAIDTYSYFLKID